jgi:cell division protein FtsB
MTSPATPPTTAKVWKKCLALLGGLAALAAVVVLANSFSSRGMYQLYRLGQERQRLERENAQLNLDNERLARTIERLQDDPEFIQDLIRRELNFVKKNEIVFQLPPGPQAAASGSAPAAAESAPPAAEKPRPWSWKSLIGGPAQPQEPSE